MSAESSQTNFRKSRLLTALREDILVGQWPTGAPLREPEVTARYGVSRNLLREILPILESEGLVTSNPYRGHSVVSPSNHEILEMAHLRRLLEAEAAAFAAVKLTRADAVSLMQRARAFTTAVPREPWALIRVTIRNDSNFHGEIWRIARNPGLSRMLRSLLFPTWLFQLLPLQKSKVTAGSERAAPLDVRWIQEDIERERKRDPDSHIVLAEAICGGDPEWARRRMHAHLRWSVAPEIDDHRARFRTISALLKHFHRRAAKRRTLDEIPMSVFLSGRNQPGLVPEGE